MSHLLPRIVESLSDCDCPGTEITTGLRLPYEQGDGVPHGPDKESEDNGDTSVTVELAERLDEIKDIMKHLYRLSDKISAIPILESR